MSDPTRTVGPYIRWQDYGPEGWHPDSFPTLEAAIKSESYGNPFVITKVVQYRIIEVRDKPRSPNSPQSAGGHARAAALSPEQRQSQARDAANKRWAK